MKLPAVASALLTLAAASAWAASAPERPRITGVSHAAFFVSDMTKARAFYEGFLGFQSPYAIPRQNPGEQLVWIKINENQSVELFPGSEVAPDADRLYHIAVEVEDAEAMRRYLQAKGVPGLPPTTPLGRIGNRNFTIKDPSGNGVEFVQYMPDGWTRRERGRFLPETRVARRLSHVGVMVGELEASLKFYRDLLGFVETWRGSASGKTLNWVNLRVPDGEDYVEFMLYDKYPSTDRLRTMHHICLEVPDLERAAAVLATRPYPAGSKPPTPMKAGVNGKRQINYYDVDGTRVELMEPTTHDGQPRPPSPAPPPVAEPKPVAAR
ncbi:MAG: VOC family protein [Verrucomicrobia bacterium]|nr:VOC family protein [Verrucomicrobiota bacterium]